MVDPNEYLVRPIGFNPMVKQKRLKTGVGEPY